MDTALTGDEKRARWRKEYKCRSMGRLYCEYEDDTLDKWHEEMEKQRARSAPSALARRRGPPPLPTAPIVKPKYFCKKCPANYAHVIAHTTHQAMHGSQKKFECDYCDYAADTKISTTEHMLKCHNTAPTIDFTGEADDDDDQHASGGGRRRVGSAAADRQAQAAAGACAADEEAPNEPCTSTAAAARKNQFRVNAVHKEPGKPEPPIKIVFLTPLPNTMDIYRTKQGVLTCKLNSARAPLVWQRDGKPIDVDDPRYQIEKDTAGRFTLTIRVVEQIDQGMWTAFVNKDVTSKCQVYVEEPRDTFVVPLESQRANEKENAAFECYVNDKEIDVEWFHDGAKIEMDGRHLKERAGRRRRLLIINVLIEDHGEYKCTTKADKTMAQLTVDPLNKVINCPPTPVAVSRADRKVPKKKPLN
ncbi:hypothetical protein niasHT_021630 [Heterodera trifolii]|uniref:Ig-like domain-containing protein n=1 Tax=Heterodera trifolii TaxID=157864 RepID=A0ABD2JT42_9BILA